MAPNYDNFPSNKNKIKFDLNQIEGSLRRQKKEKEVSLWVLLVLALIVATLAYFAVRMTVNTHAEAAHAATEAVEDSWDVFCAQAFRDHVATNTAASEDLKELCANTN